MCSFFGKSQKASFARGVISTIASEKGIAIEEMALLMNRDGSTISSLLSRFSAKHVNMPDTQKIIEKAKTRAYEIPELQA